MFAWWADVIAEGEAGEHTPVVQIGLRYGFILFIMSEVMFFSPGSGRSSSTPCTRWARSRAPGAARRWPPPGIETFDPWHLPLINTLILLCSGCAATWAHHALVAREQPRSR